jgi:hypothetical protein
MRFSGYSGWIPGAGIEKILVRWPREQGMDEMAK